MTNRKLHILLDIIIIIIFFNIKLTNPTMDWIGLCSVLRPLQHNSVAWAYIMYLTYACTTLSTVCTVSSAGSVSSATMSHVPPPYASGPDEGKGIYPSVPPDQQHPSAPPGQTAVTYYPPTGPPQQQPQQLIIKQPTPVVVAQPAQRPQSFVLHIVLSCFVFWLCGCCCGLIAFILASK